MHISKKQGYLISSILLLLLILITIFIILLFMHPNIYFSKTSGFSQRDIVKAGKNKLRFVVPEIVDTTKSTYISVKQDWFESSRMGKITAIKAKPNKYMAIDFTDRLYDSEVLTIYTKNWIGIKKEYDVIVDYSNFLRVFFSEPYTGEAPRKPVILPYSKLQTEYKHIFEELYKIKSFVPFNKEGIADGQPVGTADVFTKENARGRAFIVDNSTHISLVYDFLLKGIFENQTQKTQIIDYVDKTVGKFTTYDPSKQGIDIKFNTAPFYISKFLGWYYIDPTGNRIDLVPGQKVQIPNWVTSELRLIARYDITTDTDKIGPELDKQGLVAVSYFDGAQRVYFDIVKKGTPLKEYFYQKEGYTYAGWYKDSALTEKVDCTKELATTHTVLYLKSIKQNQPKPEKPVQYHNINFITPSDANQLFPTRRVHGQKLEINYLTPSLVSRLDEHGNLEELDYWNLVDPITGVRTKYDFNTPITQDITLEAVMRKRVLPTTKYIIKKYFESVDQTGNFVEDKTKEEIVEGQTPGQEVELSPTQTNAPYGFTLDSSSVLKKKIKKDGTTVFELKYKRNRYKVDFEVNYNGNHFKGVTTSSEPSQTVVYEGKLTRPANPAITKAGYTYTFKHWQLKDEMGNVYKEVSEFDFNTKITKNLTLVAYFEEKKDVATYTVKHIFQGISGQIDERVEEKKFTEQVGKSITVSQENRDKNYDEHFEVADFTETKTVASDGSTVFEIRYARKKYRVNFEVNYNGNHFAGALASAEATQNVPYEGKVKKPDYIPSLTKEGYTYTFVQWQLKSTMNGEYVQTQAYDFTTPITENTDLVAYFKEEKRTVNYQIKHVIEGVDDIAERIETTQHQALTDSSQTVSNVQRLTRYDEHFTVDTQEQTKQIKGDGTTVFTLNYVRKSYTVTYEVNYNGNQFTDVEIKNQPQTRSVKYQSKITKPATDPSITKIGYNYQFVQWQDEATMNGVYAQIAEFDFNNNRVVDNVTLVAYFKETIDTVSYKVIHKLEKQGKDNTLDGKYDEVVEIVENQKVEDGAHYKEYTALDNNLYEKDTTHTDNILTSPLASGNNNTVVCQHYKLKEISVEFKKTEGIKNFKSSNSIKVKKTRKIALPEYELKDNYKFIGWSLSENGLVQNEFIAGDSNMQIFAQTDIEDRKIAYTIRTQEANGTYTENTETKSGKIGSNHTVTYTNPNNTMYQEPEYSVTNLTVNADETQNKVTITLLRKKFTIVFEVLNYQFKIDDKKIRYGDKIGEINIKNILDSGYFIIKYELDDIVKTLLEINEHIVRKNHKIKVYVSDEETKIVGKYPQTYVENPEGIHEVETVEYKIKYKYMYKDYVYTYNRKYYKDKDGHKYEKYHGKYFRFEDIVFLRLPLSNIWLSKRIIDYSPVNAIATVPNDNGNIKHSILKSILQHISAIAGYNFSLPTYDDGKFSLKLAYDKGYYHKFAKIGTDYGKEVLGKSRIYTEKYRDIDFAKSMHASIYKFWDDYQYFDYWQVATNVDSTNVYSFRNNGTMYGREINIVNGVVLACE